MGKNCFEEYLTDKCSTCKHWRNDENSVGCCCPFPIMECDAFAKMTEKEEGPKMYITCNCIRYYFLKEMANMFIADDDNKDKRVLIKITANGIDVDLGTINSNPLVIVDSISYDEKDKLIKISANIDFPIEKVIESCSNGKNPMVHQFLSVFIKCFEANKDDYPYLEISRRPGSHMHFYTREQINNSLVYPNDIIMHASVDVGLDETMPCSIYLKTYY